MDAKTAIRMFHKSQLVRDVHVPDKLVIPAKLFGGTIDCAGCHFTHVSAVCAYLENHVRFVECQFDYLDLYATYFLKGLIMEQCAVVDRVVFQSGGHNDDSLISISDTRFESFVDFEDCWFTGPVRLHNVTFNQGTNLLGNKNTPMAVSFDIEPELVNVLGDLAIDTYNPKT